MSATDEMSRYENPLTSRDVEIVIEKSIGLRTTIVDYRLAPYSEEVLGFLGAHRNLVVEVLRDGSKIKESHVYFVKSVPYNIERRAKFVQDSKIFHKETCFYNDIMPELMESSRDKSWAAQCYLVKPDVLVFENLKLKNYALKGKFLDVPSLKAALSSVAKLHAASILAEHRLGKSFLELYPESIYEIVFSRDGPFAHGIGLGIDTASKVAKRLGLNYEVVPKVCDLIFDKMVPSKTRRNVLCHGDTWSNNFMFNADDNCALVDFQLLRYVPAMTDVAQLIYYNARRELRRQCEMDLLRHYHEVLCENLKSGEVSLPRFEDVVDEYEERRIVGIVTINLYFPMNRIDGETLAEMIGNPESFDRLMARDRANVVFEMMEVNEGYRRLIEDTVRELVEESHKFLK